MARPRPLDELCESLREVARRQGDEPAAAQLARAAARARRPAAVVCVAGDHASGKSALVNALIGVDVCPVDAVRATAVTTVAHHAETPSSIALVRRSGAAADAERRQLAPGDVASVVLEDPARRAPMAERVDIGLPSELLAQGIVLVDTPGAGGLPSVAPGVLAFLDFTDVAVVTVEGRGAPSERDLRFVADVTRRCPAVVCAVTKRDLWPAWRETTAATASALAAAGVDVPVVAVSATVPGGVDDLRRYLIDAAHRMASGENHAAVRAEVERVAADLRRRFERDLATLEDPTSLAGVNQDVERARELIAHLRGPAARWQSVLNDRMADLLATVSHELRVALRSAGTEADQAIEQAGTPQAWEAASNAVQERIADAVSAADTAVATGTAAIAEELVSLLRADGLELRGGTASLVLDLPVPGPAPMDDGVARRAGRGANQALDAIRGASGGLICLGMLQTILPAVGVTVLLANPVTILGIGAWTGGRTVLEQRRRNIAGRRQQVRASLRQVLDQAQADLLHQVGINARSAQGRLRDAVAGQLTEHLARANAELARAEVAARSTEAERAAREAALVDALTAVGDIEAELATVSR